MNERIIKIKKEDLCTECGDSFNHINHKRCNSCGNKVPVALESLGFANSTPFCKKCPVGSSGHNLMELLKPIKIEII